MMENIEYPLTDGLRKRIAGLESENARLKERLRWKSVEKDGLPDFQRDVLVVMVDGVIADGYTKLADNECVYFYFTAHPNVSIEIENVILWKYDSLPEEEK